MTKKIRGASVFATALVCAVVLALFGSPAGAVSPSELATRADSLREVGNLSAARTMYRHARLRADSTGVPVPLAWRLGEARCAFEDGDVEGAASVLRGNVPPDVSGATVWEARHLLARSLVRLGGYAEVVDLLSLHDLSRSGAHATSLSMMYGVCLVETDRFADAVGFLESVAALQPDLEQAARLFLGRAFEGLDRNADALEQYRASASLTGELSSDATVRVAALSEKMGAWHAAAVEWERLADRTDGRGSAEYDVNAARAYLREGESAIARRRLLRVMNGYPHTDEALDAWRILSSRGPDALETITAAYVLRRHEREDDALALLDELILGEPHGALSDRAHLARARVLLSAGRPKDALEALAKMEETGTSAADSLEYYRAEAKRALERRTEACAHYRAVSARWPDSELAPNALYEMGRTYEEMEDYSTAREAYGQVYRDYPKSRYADISVWRSAMNSYFAGGYEAAAVEFGFIVDNFRAPSFRAAGLYWQAKSLEKAGQVEQARALYRDVSQRFPHEYYAYRAQVVLGADEHSPRVGAEFANITFGRTVPHRVTGATEEVIRRWLWRPDSVSVTEDDRGLARAEALEAAGLHRTAVREARAHEKRHDDDGVALATVARWYSRHRVPDRMFEVFKRLRQLGVDVGAPPPPIELLRLDYPILYADEVLAACEAEGVDPFFVFAVIRRESRFDPNATSYAGARGLMQIMSRTGRAVARQMGLAYSRSKLYEPEYNIRLGVHYLANLLTEHGRPEYALAGYNGGPNNIARWRATPQAEQDIDAFVENITYSQTRHYVRLVMGDYAAYRAIWTQSD